MALEYCLQEKNTHIAILNPIAHQIKEVSLQILKRYGKVYYQKDIEFNPNGYINLTKNIYQRESWLGNSKNQFIGARQYAKPAFRLNTPLTIFVVYSDSVESLIQAKSAIRKLANVGNYAIHINDTHEETVALAGLLLNSNSVHYLNNRKDNNRFSNFHKHFTTYSNCLREQNINKEYFCVSGSSTLAAYGLRDSGDLDFIHFGNNKGDLEKHANIQSHNKHLSSGNYFKIHDLLFNPNYFFYYKGFKFAALEAIKK